MKSWQFVVEKHSSFYMRIVIIDEESIELEKERKHQEIQD